MQPDLEAKSFTGLLVASVILILWISSLGFLSSIDIAQLATIGIVPAVLGRTFIQTGLFILAHDAIHGVVVPGNRRFNHWVGQLAITLYALLPYQKLYLNHGEHHEYPSLPWYHLPSVRQPRLPRQSNRTDVSQPLIFVSCCNITTVDPTPHDSLLNFSKKL